MTAPDIWTVRVPFESRREVGELVSAFERCTLDVRQWDHRAHLAVAMCYLVRLREPAAIERMIQGIRRFNYAKGIRKKPKGGYHETMTLFWLGVGARVREAMADQDALTIVNTFARAPRSLPLVCYSEEVLWSKEARYKWVEPRPGGDRSCSGRGVEPGGGGR